MMKVSLSALVVLVSAVLAVDLTHELNSGWRMGLRPRQADVQNLQSFSGAIGGAQASAITNSGNPDRPFEVDGDTFNDFPTAANRACDNQKNNCAQLANSGASFEVGDCDKQSEQCKATISTAAVTSFAADPAANAEPALVSSDAQFDFFCDV